MNFTEPTAIDNSGRLARFEVKPAGFKPPVMVFEDMVVQYYAYDFDGNIAVCSVNMTVPGMIYSNAIKFSVVICYEYVVKFNKYFNF